MPPGYAPTMPASLQLAVFGRIALAAGLGYLIGLERQIRGKAAGDRTLIGVLCGAKVDLAAGLTAALTILLLESIALPGLGRFEEQTDQAED